MTVLLRLATIRSPALGLLLVARHAGGEGDVYPGRSGEAKGLFCMLVTVITKERKRHKKTYLGNLDQVKLMDIKHGPQAVRSIRMKIRPIPVLSGLVKVIVLANQLLQLALDIQDLALGEVVFHHRDLGGLEMGEETQLVRLEEQQRAALGVVTTRGTTDAVDVVAGIIGRVELDDPVDSGDVETTSRNVRADEGALGGVAELEEGVGALLLLLLAVEIENLEVDVLEELGVVLDGVAGGEEDDDLLLLHLLEEGEEEKETLVGVDYDVALIQTLDCAELLLLVDVHVQGTGTERDTREILDFGGLCGGEEHGLTVLLGQDLDDLAHLVLETDLENAVGLVDDERAHVLEDEGGVLQMIEQATGGGDEQVDALAQLLGLGATVGTADDDAVCLGVVLHELAGDAEDLEGQFAGGGDDDGAGAVSRLEAQGAEHLDSGDQEGEGLAGTGLGRAEDVLAGEQRGDTSPLDLGHLGEAHLGNGLHGLFGQVELGEVGGVGRDGGGDEGVVSLCEFGAGLSVVLVVAVLLVLVAGGDSLVAILLILLLFFVRGGLLDGLLLDNLFGGLLLLFLLLLLHLLGLLLGGGGGGTIFGRNLGVLELALLAEFGSHRDGCGGVWWWVVGWLRYSGEKRVSQWLLLPAVESVILRFLCLLCFAGDFFLSPAR